MSADAHVPRFVVERGNNMVIIMLFTLFYPLSDVNVLLQNHTDNIIWIYLQEFISYHFVERIRHGGTIVETISENLSRLFFLTGFKCDEMNEDLMVSLWEFSMTHLKCDPMIVSTKVSTTSLFALGDREDKLNMHTIKLSIPANGEMQNIRQLLRQWFYKEEKIHEEDYVGDSDSDNDLVTCVVTREICNFPKLIGFHLTRTDKTVQVDIPKKISIVAHKSLSNPKWIFHCMMCYSQKHKLYYTIMLDRDHYVAYYGYEMGYSCDINLTDPEICKQVRRDVFFVVYRFFG